MAEPIKRSGGRGMPPQVQQVLEEHYSTNPYPSANDFIFLSDNVNFEVHRIKNWFNYRRRIDTRNGNLCRPCRYFKAPVTDESHSVDSRQFRPCQQYWKAYNETGKDGDNREPTTDANSSIQSVVPSAIVHHAPAMANAGNYTQFISTNPLSSYVDMSALLRFMDAWQRTCQESLPFYPNQQFILQQHQNRAWFSRHSQLPTAQVNPHLRNTWINHQNLATMNRNSQAEQFHFNSQPPCCHNAQTNNDFSQNTATSANHQG